MVIYTGDLEATHFLNVDLDIQSTSNLDPLVAALTGKVDVLHVERIKRTCHAHLEVAKLTRDADSTIRAFCSLIESLPKPERELWNAAKIRDFNIGVQAGTRPFAHEIALAADTVRAT